MLKGKVNLTAYGVYSTATTKIYTLSLKGFPMAMFPGARFIYVRVTEPMFQDSLDTLRRSRAARSHAIYKMFHMPTVRPTTNVVQ